MQPIPLISPDGKLRLEKVASAKNHPCTLQHEIIDSFRKQRGNTVCGLASLSVLLTARKRSLAKREALYNSIPDPSISVRNDDLFVDEDDVYPMVDQKLLQTDNGSDFRSIVKEEKIRTSGMTLDQARDLAESIQTTDKAIAFFPAIENSRLETASNSISDDVSLVKKEDIDPIIPDKSSRTPTERRQVLRGIEDLREVVIDVLSKPASSGGLVLNYHMTTLGQTPFGGHLSPVAAFDKPSDSLLIMDVWHTQTEPIWAPLSTVWKAMIQIDPESQSPRGLLHVVHKTG